MAELLNVFHPQVADRKYVLNNMQEKASIEKY